MCESELSTGRRRDMVVCSDCCITTRCHFVRSIIERRCGKGWTFTGIMLDGRFGLSQSGNMHILVVRDTRAAFRLLLPHTNSSSPMRQKAVLAIPSNSATAQLATPAVGIHGHYPDVDAQVQANQPSRTEYYLYLGRCTQQPEHSAPTTLEDAIRMPRKRGTLSAAHD